MHQEVPRKFDGEKGILTPLISNEFYKIDYINDFGFEKLSNNMCM